MRLLPMLCLLSCATPARNTITLPVTFLDAKEVPFADTFHVCTPKSDQTMHCISMDHFLEMARENRMRTTGEL